MDRSADCRSKTAGVAGRFAADRSGNFAIMAAVVFVPVLMSIAAAADISFFYSDRTAVQAATDAAALAAAKQFALDQNPQRLEDYAQSIFAANTARLTRTTSTLKYEGTDWTPKGTRELKISVCSYYDPFFLSALNISFAGLKGQSCANTKSVVAVGSTTVEVAFVLDTSGSMGDSPAAGGEAKIATLKTQAAKAINTIFGSSTSVGGEDPVRVGVVPFSGGVNIGASHLDDWWMDPTGISPIHHENLDWVRTYKNIPGAVVGASATAKDVAKSSPSGVGYVSNLNPSVYLTRQLIYKTMVKNTANPNLAYKGCVESRPTDEFALSDKPPSNLKPASLFVPYFAPDEPDGYGSNDWTNQYVNDGTYPSNADVERLKDTRKYLTATRATFDLGANYNNSPSYMCDSAPLTPLTGNKQTALDAVGKLEATGATNVPQGVEWGWKVLSKNEPFTEGRANGEENNIKAMIVMTDGQNTYYNEPYIRNKVGTSIFGAYGYTGLPDPNTGVARLFDYKTGVSTAKTESNYTTAMNGRLAAICENAKGEGKIKLKDTSGAQLSDEKGPVSRDGILIYTIAFDIPAEQRVMVNGLLKGCASYKLNDLRDTKMVYKDKGKYFYSASNAKDLESAFSDIMASLTSLRIAR